MAFEYYSNFTFGVKREKTLRNLAALLTDHSGNHSGEKVIVVHHVTLSFGLSFSDMVIKYLPKLEKNEFFMWYEIFTDVCMKHQNIPFYILYETLYNIKESTGLDISSFFEGESYYLLFQDQFQ